MRSTSSLIAVMLVAVFALHVNAFQVTFERIDDQGNIVDQDIGDVERSQQLSEINQSRQLVNEALYHELYGRNKERNHVLDAAAKIDKANPQVKWQRGMLYQDNQWKLIDQAAAKNRDDQKLIEYQQLRNRTEDDEAGQIQLAQWCEQNGLQDQQRAHLSRVLQHNPNNQVARDMLGFVQVNGRWYSQQEVQDVITRLSLDQKRVSAWQAELSPLQGDVFGSSDHKRKLAIAKLLEIDEPSAVIPIELMFCGVSNEVDHVLIDHFASIDCADTSETLARIAVYHGSAKLRKKAANALKNRDQFEYVPDLLSTMQTPIAGRYDVVPDSRGQIVYRHVFFQQLQDQNVVAENNRVYRRVRLPGGSRSQSRRVALFDAAVNISNNTIAQNSRNLQIAQLNNRVCETLRTGTGEKMGDDPRMWWKWWNDVNEVYFTSTKPVTVNRRAQLVQIIDKPQVPNMSGQGQQSDDPAGAGSAGNQDVSVDTANTEITSGVTGSTNTLPETTSSNNTGVVSTPTNPTESQGNSVEVPPRSMLPPEPRQSTGTGNVSTVTNGEFSTVEVMATDGETAECLVAGTLIETEIGPKRIEQIRVGDRVLTKAIDTGELSYQPVLDTTIRPFGTVFEILLENESIKCSGGHPFWVSGRGWVVARELKSGMPIHTVNGVVNVSLVIKKGKEETFNLVVSDRHNYFVGKSKILSHDNSLRQSTQVLVPGFIE